MKKVLVLYFSQSGQLQRILERLVDGLKTHAKVYCDCRKITAIKPYPYPWSFYRFFNVFPEAVLLDGCAVEPLDLEEEYDLIILGYTIWFLSPSLPVTGFLQTEQAARLFRDTPVVTVIGCRDMWLIGQEKMKVLLADLGARLLDNVALTDQGKSLYTFVTTPRWMLTGKKDSFWFFPRAGVANREIHAVDRFGRRLAEALEEDEEQGNGPLLSGLGAVNVNGKLIATERIAHRSFLIWSKLMKKAGPPDSIGRNAVITIYACFLLCLVLTVVPLNMLVRKLVSPFRKKSLAKAVAYYEQPSGR
ncbi:MAG: dialkylrecorsinol condensing enzyme [Desulfobulbus sp.]|nr:MAG: dialkylrecorsinol condensing enzyme [Desulfobulbus sp.]RUM36988.1 MAG: dialkylrecorsinol condensing enzyme [Desulfobulbus sp.]